MTIRFTCPYCQKTIRAKPEQAGKRFRCPNQECRNVITVPNADATPDDSSLTLSNLDVESQDSPARGPSPAPATEDGIPEIWKPGDVILDLYEVKEVLSQGGFGSVCRVFHLAWNVDLAVKSLLPILYSSEGLRERFCLACETWMKLGPHPHVVRCHEVRILGGILRAFLEYVEGGTLDAWIRNARVLDLKTALDIAIQIAWGMAFVHSQGVIHLNLKPRVVLMKADGTAKVGNFGLARRWNVASDASGTSSDGGVLITVGAGTPGYAAPEQWRTGATVDRRADVFAYGVLLWRLLGGQITWAGEARKSLVARHVVMLLLKRGELQGLPQSLVDLILTCLEPDPKQRWSDFDAVCSRLRAIYAERIGEPYARPEPQSHPK